MSRCNYCFEPVLWVSKSNGGWYPPFDMPTVVKDLKYHLRWDGTGWMAEPEDKSQVINLEMHNCAQYESHVLNRQKAPVENDDVIELDTPEQKERLVYVDKPAMSHAQLTSIAKKIAQKCVQCNAEPFAWCTYITGDNFGEETGRLHNMRGL